MKSFIRPALALLLVAPAAVAGEEGVADRLKRRGAAVGHDDSRPDCPVVYVGMPEGTTDADLRDLCELRRLDALDLAGTDITDDGLRRLSDLRWLRCLRLSGTGVTDAGLRHLESMTGLRALHLRDCPGVTDAGVARLRDALPGCDIVR